MRILIFEWLTSGGLWLDGERPSEHCPIQRQGCRMLNAVATDLAAGGFEAIVLVDSRLPTAVAEQDGLIIREIGEGDDLPKLLPELANESDLVLVIAPETDSILTRCLEWLEPVKHKLLNPDLAFARLASNKSQLFEHLESKGFAKFPTGVNFQTFLDQVAHQPDDRSAWKQMFEVPAVLKPIDGAGGEEVMLIEDWAGFEPQLSRPNDRYRLEEFVSGAAVSVSVLCGGDQYDVLTPTIQLFDPSHKGLSGHYVAARYPIAEDFSRRAVELVCEVLPLLPKTRGYIGLDLVISDSGDPAEDRLIEINPRLTMSYPRLSEVYGQTASWDDGSAGQSNLAMRMVTQANQQVTESDVICTFRAPCP